MVSKCANQNCAAEFHRLVEGKVFVAELRPGSVAARKRRYAWLCDKCAERMTVIYDDESDTFRVAFRASAA